jgi:S1-C subfamily serine protease
LDFCFRIIAIFNIDQLASMKPVSLIKSLRNLACLGAPLALSSCVQIQTSPYTTKSPPNTSKPETIEMKIEEYATYKDLAKALKNKAIKQSYTKLLNRKCTETYPGAVVTKIEPVPGDESSMQVVCVKPKVNSPSDAVASSQPKPTPYQDKATPSTLASKANSSVQPGAIEEVCKKSKEGVVTIYAGHEVGSGSLIEAELIITNKHVVSEKTKKINVKFSDGRIINGDVIGSDSRLDLALIKLNTPQKQRPVLNFSDDEPKPGMQICAIGSPFGKAGTITIGTFKSVSPRGSLILKVLLRPGNSGGPSLSEEGTIIAVNKGIPEITDETNIGIGYATSAKDAKRFVEETKRQNNI